MRRLYCCEMKTVVLFRSIFCGRYKQKKQKSSILNFKLEQIQDFTPTPMTLATTMFYTGLNPYTMQPVYVAKTREEKRKQNSYFFWWKPQENIIKKSQQRTHRAKKNKS